MYEHITTEEYKEYNQERIEVGEDVKKEWKMEVEKMQYSLFLNIFCIGALILSLLYLKDSNTDLASRFMSLLEIVIGAIFGITATQIAKE